VWITFDRRDDGRKNSFNIRLLQSVLFQNLQRGLIYDLPGFKNQMANIRFSWQLRH